MDASPSLDLGASGSARPVPAARLGDLDRGVVATGGRGAAATIGATTTVSWWVGADDRWYRPADEPSTRDRLVGGSPVVESSVRVPGGDVTGRVTVARAERATVPSVLFEVDNATPVPVALAWVVASDRPLEVVGDRVLVEGVGELALTRPAMGWHRGPDVDAVLAALADGMPGESAPTGRAPGVVAALVPLPHTARAVAAVSVGEATAAPVDRAPLDRTLLPATDRVVAGWAGHRADAPRPDVGDERRAEMYDAAVADVVLGPDPGATPRHRAEHVAALGRLGRVQDLAPLDDLLDDVKSNGSLPDPDSPVAATVALVDALTTWWGGGLAPAEAERLLGVLAEATRWLDRRRRRAEVAALGADATDALGRAAAWFDAADQPHVAAAVRAHVGALGSPVADRRRQVRLAAARREALAWSSDGRVPDAVWSARFVRWSIDGVAADLGAAVDLYGEWEPSALGVQVEAHDVPTAAGRVSYGLRWHGTRPALLWEVTPWPDRPRAGSFRLTASVVDPSWSTGEWAGEALLAEPAGIEVGAPLDVFADHPALTVMAVRGDQEAPAHGAPGDHDHGAHDHGDHDHGAPSGGTFS